MDTIYHVPTPKTPTKDRNFDTTRDDRLQIQTLYFTAGWTIDQIVLSTNWSTDQVRYAINHRLTPQKKKSGCRPYLNTPQRKQLIQWVTSSRQTRRVPWSGIPAILGFECGEKAIRTAMKKEGYTRGIARRKPPLSEEVKKERLAWAWEHIFWTDEQWDSILWTDETWVNPGRHRRDWVIRKIGQEELYHPDCI
jgi:hypothetical protein